MWMTQNLSLLASHSSKKYNSLSLWSCKNFLIQVHILISGSNIKSIVEISELSFLDSKLSIFFKTQNRDFLTFCKRNDSLKGIILLDLSKILQNTNNFQNMTRMNFASQNTKIACLFNHFQSLSRFQFWKANLLKN